MESSIKYKSNDRAALNIVLIGMPGCGKTTIGMLLSRISGMEFIDIDKEIEKSSGMTIEQIFSEYGEEHFRSLEAAETARAGNHSGAVIATGGGVVKLRDNYDSLHKNGRIYFIQRNVSELATNGRPLSKDKTALAELYKERLPLYHEFADCVTPVGDLAAVAEFIWKDFQNYS